MSEPRKRVGVQILDLPDWLRAMVAQTFAPADLDDLKVLAVPNGHLGLGVVNTGNALGLQVQTAGLVDLSLFGNMGGLHLAPSAEAAQKIVMEGTGMKAITLTLVLVDGGKLDEQRVAEGVTRGAVDDHRTGESEEPPILDLSAFLPSSGDVH